MLNNKKIFILFSLVCFALFAKAQDDAFTKAYRFVTAENADSAKYYIDMAMTEKNSQNDPMVWFLKGLIYKEMYKRYEKGNAESNYRKIALEALTKSDGLDSTKEYSTNNRSLKYWLASTYYSDAASLLDTITYNTSITCFYNYMDILATVDTSKANLKIAEIKFQLALATVYTQIYDSDKKNKIDFLNLAKNAYNKVLTNDPNNISANFNMGILYYNQAATLIVQQDFEIDIIALNDIQDNSIKLFKESLPFMEKAYELDPKRAETLMGLSGIYYSLNEFEKSKLFQKKLEEVQREGK
jgi:hypothetical protein